MSTKKYHRCAFCGGDIEDWYYMVTDNFLQVKYFEEEDGSDNAFCSTECVCDSLMVEAKLNKEEEW